VNEGKAEDEGRVGYIAAADVQQPGDRGWIADHRRILLRLAQQPGDLLALFVRAAPCVLQWMGNSRRHRWRRTVAPNGVDWIALDRDHRKSRIGIDRQSLLADQQRVVTDAGFRRCIGGHPAGRRILGDMPPLPEFRTGLCGQLEDVAPVGECRGLVWQHRSQSGTAGEAGQPGQPLG
jgi:hypothetical protein